MTAILAPSRLRAAVRVDPVLATLGVLIVVGGVLRFATLGVQSYWLDEATTVGLLRHSFGGMLSAVYGHETTPPLFYAVAWLWRRVFGDGEVGLRSMSALAGTATIPVAYAAAHELAGRRTALIVAALTAVAPPLIWYSQEARDYALLVLLTACSLLFFARAWNQRRARDVALWGIASALALATHYFAVFLAVPEAVLLLWRPATRRPAALASAGIVATGAALAPFVLHQRAAGGFVSGSPFFGRLKAVPYFFAVGPESNLRVNVVLLATGAAFAVALVLVLSHEHSRARTGALVALGVGAAAFLLPVAAKLVGNDFLNERNQLAAWLPLVIFVAAGLALAPRVVAIGAVIAIGALYVVLDVNVASSSQHQRDDWREVAKALGPAATPRMVVLTPYWQFAGLAHYHPDLTRMKTMQPIGEIVTIDNWTAPSDAPLPPPGPPFRPVSKTTVQHFTIARFRADPPVLVTPVPFDPSHRAPALDFYEARR